MSEPKRCKLCPRPLIEGATNELCDSCRAGVGASPFAPSQRPHHPCARCHGRVFVRAVPRTVDRTDSSKSVETLHAALGTKKQSFWTGYAGFNTDQRFGRFETWICRGCGFVEWYCQYPEEIPIGEEFSTQLVELEGDGPFR